MVAGVALTLARLVIADTASRAVVKATELAAVRAVVGLIAEAGSGLGVAATSTKAGLGTQALGAIGTAKAIAAPTALFSAFAISRAVLRASFHVLAVDALKVVVANTSLSAADAVIVAILVATHDKAGRTKETRFAVAFARRKAGATARAIVRTRGLRAVISGEAFIAKASSFETESLARTISWATSHSQGLVEGLNCWSRWLLLETWNIFYVTNGRGVRIRADVVTLILLRSCNLMPRLGGLRETSDAGADRGRIECAMLYVNVSFQERVKFFLIGISYDSSCLCTQKLLDLGLCGCR